MQRVLAGLFLLTLTSPSLADGLDPHQVAADARWVIHVDLSAACRSQTGQALHARFVKEAKVQRALARMRKDLGFDLTKDLHSVTFYDNGFESQRGVAIIEAENIDHEKLVARLKKDKPGHTTTRHADHTIYTWTEAEGRRHEHQVSGSFHGDRHLLFSRDADKLATALDVLEKKSESLPKNSPLSADATPGAILVARAVGIADQKTPFRSPVMRDARQFSLTIGERNGDLFVQGMLVADSSENAARLRKTIETLYALARHRAGNDPAVKKVLGGLNLVVADATIAGEWRAPSKDVLQLMESMDERRRRRSAQNSQDDAFEPRDPGEKAGKRSASQP